MPWKLDPANSEVLFRVKHFRLTTVKGRFKSFEGTLDMNEENPQASTVEGTVDTATISTEVEFRPLSDAEIQRYVDFDQPTDCAGAFKSESAGPTLLRAMHSSDPTAIIGLPLIAVSAALRQAGYTLP
mgnify:CR=1 FL=1